MGPGRCFPLVLFVALVLVPSGARLHAEDEPGNDGAVLRGVVVDAKGAPAQGVAVRVWTHHGGIHGWSRERIERCFDPDAKSHIVGSTRTDAAGRWQLGGMVHRRLYGVAASGKDETRSPTRWTFAFRGAPPATELKLAPTVALDGRLVDAKGTGLAGVVTVAANPPVQRHGAWAQHGSIDTLELKTAKDGRFKIHAPAGYRLFVRAEVPGLGAVSHTTGRMPSTDAPAQAAPLTIAMRQGGGASLSGTVRNEAGQAIAGAQVVAEVRSAAGGTASAMTTAYAVSDAAGAYALTDLPGDVLTRLVVAKPGFALATLPQSTSDAAGSLSLADGTNALDVTLAPGRVIRGHVLDTKGEPLEGAWVRFDRDNTFYSTIRWSTARTDASGAFVLEHLPYETGRVVAGSATHVLPRAPEPQPHGANIPAPGHRVLATAGDTMQGVRLELAVGYSLMGKLVDRDGAPVASALVRLESPRMPTGHGGVDYLRELTNAKGAFAFHGLPQLTYARVEIDTPGFAKLLQPIAPPQPGAPLPTITLARGGTITGRITDAEGRPIPNAPIRGAGTADVAFANADGVYALVRVPPGSHSLFLANWQGQLLGSEQRIVTIEEGETIRGIDFTVAKQVPPQGTKIIQGTLVDVDGGAVEGATVRIQSAEGLHVELSTQSDARGEFRFANLRSGNYRIYAGSVPQQIPLVKAGTLDLRIVVPPTRTHILQGEVRGPDGSLVPAANVQIRFPGDARGTRRYTAGLFGGRFRLAVPVDVTTVTIEVRDPRDVRGRLLDLCARPRHGIRVDAGPAILKLQQAAVLRGVVLDDQNKPVARLPLRATLPSESHWQTPAGGMTETDAQGRFVLKGLEPRAYKLVSKGLPGWSIPRPLLVTAPRSDIELAVRRYKDLAGQLLDAEGKPIARVRAWAEPKSRTDPNARPSMTADGRRMSLLTAHTDTEGKFTLKHLPPEFLWTIRFNLPTHIAATHFPPVLDRIEAGGPVSVIRLNKGLVIKGIVRDPEGRGEKGLRVTSYGPAGPAGRRPASMSRTATTDASGRFQIGPLPPKARVTLSVVVTPQQRSQGIAWLPVVHEDVLAGRTDVELQLSRGGEIRGQVRGATADMLKGSTLVLRAAKGRELGRFRFDGTTTFYRFGGLAPGMYEITPWMQGRTGVRLPAKTMVEAPHHAVMLDALVTVKLRGRMTGVKPAGFSVQFLPSDGTRARRAVPLKADGTFDLGTVENRPGWLLIRHPQSPYIVCEPLTPSNQRVAARPEKMKRLEGRIAKLPGKIRRSKITARRGPVTFQGKIAEDGNFSFEGLPLGAWQLEIKLGSPYKGTFKPKKPVRAGDLFAVVEWE